MVFCNNPTLQDMPNSLRIRASWTSSSILIHYSCNIYNYIHVLPLQPFLVVLWRSHAGDSESGCCEIGRSVLRMLDGVWVSLLRWIICMPIDSAVMFVLVYNNSFCKQIRMQYPFDCCFCWMIDCESSCGKWDPGWFETSSTMMSLTSLNRIYSSGESGIFLVNCLSVLSSSSLLYNWWWDGSTHGGLPCVSETGDNVLCGCEWTLSNP